MPNCNNKDRTWLHVYEQMTKYPQNFWQVRSFGVQICDRNIFICKIPRQCIQVGNFGFKSVAQKLAAPKYFKIGDQSAVLRHFAYKYVAQTELYPKYPKTAQSRQFWTISGFKSVAQKLADPKYFNWRQVGIFGVFWLQICGLKVGRLKESTPKLLTRRQF